MNKFTFTLIDHALQSCIMCSVTVMKKQLFFLSPRHEKGAAKKKREDQKPTPA
jgi:hypothetical protein